MSKTRDETPRMSDPDGSAVDKQRPRSTDGKGRPDASSVDSKEVRESQQGDGVGVISASPSRAAGEPSHQDADGRRSA
jgi:hypothetical protein